MFGYYEFGFEYVYLFVLISRGRKEWGGREEERAAEEGQLILKERANAF